MNRGEQSRFVRLAAVFLILQAVDVCGQSATLPPTDDKTGTNPLNIQTTVSVLNDFQSQPDGLYANRTRYQYMMPLDRRRMSARLDAPFVVSNITGRTEAALGDLGARWQWIPWIAGSRGVIVGLDTTWNTATNAALGSGRHTVAPFVQAVFHQFTTAIVVASYEQRLSAGGDAGRSDVSVGTATFYVAWLPSSNVWLIIEPKLIADYELDNKSGRIDVAAGRLLLGGVGTYVRPGIGIGQRAAKPFDWKLEVGFHIIP